MGISKIIGVIMVTPTSTEQKWKIAFLIFLIVALSLVIWSSVSSGLDYIPTSKTTPRPEKDCSTIGSGDWIDGISVNFSCIGIFGYGSKSYHEATTFCASLDSHLVEIFTEEQQDFLTAKIRDKFGRSGDRNFWIGLKFNGSNWHWQHSNRGLQFNGFVDCYGQSP